MKDQEPDPSYRTIRVTQNNDVELLIALASMFYLYRKFDKALSVVAVAEHLKPNAQSALELKAVLLCELNRYGDVLTTVAQIEALATTPLAHEIGVIKKRAERALAICD